MALIYPFKGHRFNKGIVGDLNLVVTQPYDKITAQMQEEYYRRSPYNVVQVTLNLERNSSPDTDYAGAGKIFRSWLEQKTLVQDSVPAIYAYYQSYEVDGQSKLQRGFTALLDLKHSAAGIIPHERTLAAPKMDRLRLMRSIESNDDVIYMIYADESLSVNRILDAQISGRQPEIEVKDEYGAIHRVWAVVEREALKNIQEAMQSQELFIADGHHRFETSVNFMHECEQKNWKPVGVESFDKRMVTCFNSVDGVTILPTHRLIRDLTVFDPRAFLQAVAEYFEVETLFSAGELWAKMKQASKGHLVGFYAGGTKCFHILRMREKALNDPLMLDHVEPYRHLDVSILHTLILERYLGIDEGKLVAQTHVDYARDRELCIRQVDEGKYQAAFFLNPTTAEQMQRVASLGERMPQKSTDFYPKLLTGLVFAKMTIKKD